jgi:hypothetical protein
MPDDMPVGALTLHGLGKSCLHVAVPVSELRPACIQCSFGIISTHSLGKGNGN